MRAWILGVALTGATGGGVAFVLAGKPEPCGPSAEATPASPCTEGGCPSCKASAPTDVTDLSALLASSVDTSRPQVSFDEPPFAQPVKAVVAEVAPLPRAAAEEGPMPRRLSGEEAPMPRAAR
jgi:hypothetical protein